MCAVSMIVDHYQDKWRQYQIPPPPTFVPVPLPSPGVTPAEIAEFRLLLERAREYDKRNNEPDCELAEKKVRLLKLAKELKLKKALMKELETALAP